MIKLGYLQWDSYKINIVHSNDIITKKILTKSRIGQCKKLYNIGICIVVCTEKV